MQHGGGRGGELEADRLAAAGGDVAAMARLGRHLRKVDPHEARRWLERAARAGDRSAMANLGNVCDDAGDVEAAGRWWGEAAELGSPAAMVNLGVLQARDDPSGARRWYEKAAAMGDARGMFRLGQMLAASDPIEARRWWERAAAKGDVAAMGSLGNLFHGEGDAVGARRWWEQAAGLGSAKAMVNLGVIAAAVDPVEARRWWERAAATGDASAMLRLGYSLRESDPVRARRWLQRAAAAGEVKALLRLGLADRVADPVQSRLWLQAAADMGDVRAMTVLGAMLSARRDGRKQGGRGLRLRTMTRVRRWVGRDEDSIAAERWLGRASDLGDVDATRMLARFWRFRHPRRSARLFDQAAAKGDPASIAAIGSRMARHAMVWFRPHKPELRQAINLLTPAAEAGDTVAMTSLGGLLLVAGELDDGERWLGRAACSGARAARFTLGLHQLSDPHRALQELAGTVTTRPSRPWRAILRLAAHCRQRPRPPAERHPPA